MAKKNIKFKDFEVEHDDATQEVKIKKKGESDFKDATISQNGFLMYLRADGSEVETKDGDMVLTHSNPTCWWIFSGGRWKLKCIN